MDKIILIKYPNGRVEYLANGEAGDIIGQNDNGYLAVYFRGRSVYEAGRGSRYQPGLTLFLKIDEEDESIIKATILLEVTRGKIR